MPLDPPPTLYLTNWSSPALHGPGRKWTAMAEPRAWEWGAGRVRALTPLTSEVRPALAERRAKVSDGPAFRSYRTDFTNRLTDWEIGRGLQPGSLVATVGDDIGGVASPGRYPPLADGDTVCCACARAERAAGRCHLAWAVPFLTRAGWRVILDGQPV
jgi:hypothetical protein